jgi:hypothetical protein
MSNRLCHQARVPALWSCHLGLPKRRGLLKASWRKRPPLNRWTRNVAIRTEHAAMPLFGFQHLMAGCAFVKKLAVVGWHLYSFAEPAMRACKRAFRNNIHNRIYHHRTRSAPAFISWACAVALSKRDWKSHSWGKALYAAGIDPNLYFVYHRWRKRKTSDKRNPAKL